MPIPYNREQLRELREQGARIVRPTREQLDSLRRYRRQFGEDVRLELVRRDTLDGSEYQPQIVIKGGNI